MPPDPPWTDATLRLLIAALQEQHKLNRQMIREERELRDAITLLRGSIEDLTAEQREHRASRARDSGPINVTSGVVAAEGHDQ